jgi:hypothetical protein
VTTVLAPLTLRRALRREIGRAGHDLVVIGAAVPAWWPAVAAWRLARRCPAPVVRAAAPAAQPRPAAVPARLAGAG